MAAVEPAARLVLSGRRHASGGGDGLPAYCRAGGRGWRDLRVGECAKGRAFRPRVSRVRGLAALSGAVTVALFTGCGRMSPLDPGSEPARRISTLWWAMLAVATIVFAGACVMLVTAWVRRGRSGLPIVGERDRLF